ncbi:phosphatidylcholine:ceramide cholinephosphotransferase 2 isoform X2 [Pristis pectinata]|uniref:phosphatidylcholine:ceramide cholinephosphotransferase 2 isoform X2 n=1 Tax=Pristis pectinata TaxID=685728 RepID=UPI00223CE706|nr:phosphatidylcholine:ceramide cholinephosphotransferase 2 isoform X2 [Pristis pectinata]
MEVSEAVSLEDHTSGQQVMPSSGHARSTLLPVTNDGSKSNNIPNGIGKSQKNPKDFIQISVPDSNRKFPLEWWKTGVAFIYALFNLIMTSVMITVVHERVPPKEKNPPLPDTFFDYVDRVEWAFKISEVNGLILVGLWTIQWLLLRYRCITMYITTLPVPECISSVAPKLYGDSQAKLQRILKLISGGGLSITGSHIMCGDFLYSGHTVMLTITYLFIKEYSPRRLWWYSWYLWICWLLSASGIMCILIAHEHYSVDVLVAYYITTRLFWWYHTMANIPTLKTRSQTNQFSNVWWFQAFLFLEKNVQTSVPCSYVWPLSWPPSCLKLPCWRYSRVQKL